MSCSLERGPARWAYSQAGGRFLGLAKDRNLGLAKIKVECSRRASELVALGMEICGGVSSFDEFGLIRHHNDLFVTRVGEGSNFALKDLIVRPLRKG